MFYCLALILLAVSPSLALWPLPTTFSKGSTALLLSASFNFDISGIVSPPKDLLDAISRSKKRVLEDKLERLVPDRGASDAALLKDAPSLESLFLILTGDPKSISEVATAKLGKRDEAYNLTVPSNGSPATISAATTLGLFRGLTTFEQIWYTHDKLIYTLEAPYNIEDAPRYPYRGFMLDTSRNYFPVNDIKRTMDAMSWVKMSTFHWHIVDSQSFPIQVSGFTELSEKGAYSTSMVYTPHNVREIISYANAVSPFPSFFHLGIDDVPTARNRRPSRIRHPRPHIHNIQSIPEHIACPEQFPWRPYANEPPSGQLRITSPSTTNFTTTLVRAFSSMFNSSKYFSLGGDEINSHCYEDDPETQETLTSSGKDFSEALSDFTAATHAVLRDAGKVPVEWEEMVLEYDITSGTIENDTIVMVWRSSNNAQSVVEKGYKIIHAASDYFYLDCGGGGWIGAGDSWCDPFKTWQHAYTFDPTANLTAEQARLVLGGQQLLWTEQSSPANLDSIVWPRAASSAEVFWSGTEGDGSGALPRLHELAGSALSRFSLCGARCARALVMALDNMYLLNSST